MRRDGVEVDLEVVRLLSDGEDGAGRCGEGAGHVRNPYNCCVRILEQIMNMSNLKLRNVQYLLGLCLTFVLLRLGLVSPVCHLVLMRMPGRSSGVPMNSMPAASRAVLMALRLAFVLLGTPVVASMRFIVRTLMELSEASCSMLQFSAARPERI